ncbi:hypothetical protein C2I27_28115 [Priestia megaterium]|uniref:hypothetical protein n=1 Tax=Priestia megaterium TaxID=1404 RepID=UPI000D5204AA|nr:hypothetical protein [Priestia megaterium]PVC62009.1 hypothetical protein C2I27_28115 [Priestia megaterium]
MIGGQGEDSCGKSGKGAGSGKRRRSGSDEEAHRPPAESKVLHGNQQRWSKRSLLAPVCYLFVFRLNGFRCVSASFW